MQLLPSVANMQPVPRAGKHAAGTKRGKICNWCQARENTQVVSSAGKHAGGIKRGKTCNRYQPRESIQKVQSTGENQYNRLSFVTCSIVRNASYFTSSLNYFCLYRNNFLLTHSSHEK